MILSCHSKHYCPPWEKGGDFRSWELSNPGLKPPDLRLFQCLLRLLWSLQGNGRRILLGLSLHSISRQAAASTSSCKLEDSSKRHIWISAMGTSSPR